MRHFILTICILASLTAFSQEGLPGGFFKGYASSLRGGGFKYHSPQPDVTSSLLLRSIDSVQYIEWNTEMVPADYTASTVNLVWIFGIDANADSHRFTLRLNGTDCLVFSNPVISDISPWTVKGENGSELRFRPVMLDKYEDPMGYAILTVPVSLIRKGAPQVIRVTGESKGSRSWYMTFEAGVEERVTVAQVPALVRGAKGNSLPLLFRIVHLGEPALGTIRMEGIPETPISLITGFNEFRVMLPAQTPPGEHEAIVAVDGKDPLSLKVTINPVRQYTVYLVQHTHTDIGYTRPQTEILPDHLRYIDYALDFCDLTDSLPDDARFRWTCETSWAVREYLAVRSEEQCNRLLRRVKEGRIELTGLFLNGSDLADETTIAATLQAVKTFRDKGFPVQSAMQSDINGVPWALAEYLPVAGIEYLNMAQNTHRAMKPFDRPTTFWWESPSGKRLMVNRPEHYMWANSLGILSRPETFATALFRHLDDIARQGYPYDRYAIQFSGYLTDNSPPSTTACRMVKEWNEMYVWPKLRLATLSEFMDYMKQKHADKLPVLHGAWPDWWMDGFGSDAIATAYARKAHTDLIANHGLMTMAAVMGVLPNPTINRMLDEITDDIAFYDEHTFGAAESITDPLCENSVVQLGEKEAYVWSAVKKNHLLREAIMGGIQPLLPRATAPTLTLFNPSGIVRNGVAEVYIDHQLLPRDRQFRIHDEGGAVVAIQPLSTREEGTWWALRVKDIGPLGFRTYRIDVTGTPREKPVEPEPPQTFENRYYRLTFDPGTGRINGLFDKEWGIALSDPAAGYGVGEIVYERLGKNRGQLEQYRLDEVTRRSWTNVRVTGMTDGPVYKAIVMTGLLEGCADGEISCEIRLYHDLKRIGFYYSLKKLAVTDPEGLYVAFPFALEGGKLIAQVAGGTMVAGHEQVEGSSTDWTGIQDFMALRSRKGQIVLVSPEIPLVQPGALNLGKFYRAGTTKEPWPVSGHIFSWVMNNYWTTNFLASQEGELKWHYVITSAPDTSNSLAVRFGTECRIPMPARVFTGSPREKGVMMPRSFFVTNLHGVELVSARPAPDYKSITLQLRESAGKSDSIPLNVPFLSSVTLSMAVNASGITEVNVLGDPLKECWASDGRIPAPPGGNWLSFRPYETKFLRLGLKPERPGISTGNR